MPTDLEPRLLKRFWSRIVKTDECWPWVGGVNPAGYGLLWLCGENRRTYLILAHRLSYFLATGVDPDDKHVCHRCDNPPCCNPAHLFLGTDADNVADAKRKGRMKNPPLRSYTRLTDDIVRQARIRRAAGETYKAIANDFGVTRTCISSAVRGETWGHVS
jgi:hypothetical protein